MANAFRFRQQHRLLLTAEYTGIFGQRRVLRGSLFDLHFGSVADTKSTARLGVVVPKRNAALSVTRNYCKRVAREIFRHRRSELPTLDLVLRLAKPTKTMSREALGPILREDFDKLLARLPR